MWDVTYPPFGTDGVSGSRITIVVDEEFGARLDRQADLGPVWVVKSIANQTAAELFWNTTPDAPDQVTVFNAEGDAPEEEVRSILDTVDLHHPGWTAIEIVGAQPIATLVAVMREYSDGAVEATPDGFVFSRNALPD